MPPHRERHSSSRHPVSGPRRSDRFCNLTWCVYLLCWSSEPAPALAWPPRTSLPALSTPFHQSEDCDLVTWYRLTNGRRFEVVDVYYVAALRGWSSSVYEFIRSEEFLCVSYFAYITKLIIVMKRPEIGLNKRHNNLSHTSVTTHANTPRQSNAADIMCLIKVKFHTRAEVKLMKIYVLLRL